MNSKTGRGFWFWFALLYLGAALAQGIFTLLDAHRPLHIGLALLGIVVSGAGVWLAWNATRAPLKEPADPTGMFVLPLIILPAQAGRMLATVADKLETGKTLDTFDLYLTPFMIILCVVMLFSWKSLAPQNR